MSNPNPSLHYAPPSLQKRRRLNVGLACGLLIVLIGVPILIFNGPILEHAQQVYQERAVASYAPARDYVVYEEEPVAAAKLVKDGGYSVTGHLDFQDEEHTYGATAPQQTLYTYLTTVVPYLKMQQSIHDTDRYAIAFSGMRRRPDGTNRLVMLIGRLGSRNQFICAWFVIKPGGFFGKPIVLGKGGWPDEDETRNGAPFLPFRNDQILAGQRDPSNASKFTVETVIDGVHHLTTGELTDQDGVHFESADAQP